MSGHPPPSDIQPSELFLKLIEAPRPSDVVDYPRANPDGSHDRVRVLTLRTDEHDQARIRAVARLKAKGISGQDASGPVLGEVLADQVAKEIVAMAIVSEAGQTNPNSGHITFGRIFRNGDDCSQLPPDELLFLFNAYQLTQAKYGISDRMDPADVDAWTKRLVEGASAYPLLHLPLPDLAELTTLLAERVYSLCTVLASRLSSLPPGLASLLESLMPGIASYGPPAASSGSTGGERSVTEDPVTGG